MSTNNFLAIIKNADGTFSAYDCCADGSYDTLKSYKTYDPIFNADTIESAILQAQQCETEYGYFFVNLKEKVEKNE